MPPGHRDDAAVDEVDAGHVDERATSVERGVARPEGSAQAGDGVPLQVVERDDLLQSIADTQQAITELDQVSRERFEQAFAVINNNFAEAFHAIFGGGTGEMRMTEPDSSGDAGIDMVAQPPGKKLQNVLLLSGGEKAMTALALLIAIFRYQPSPFCILDEVDAPLDEANVGRFTRLVTEMNNQTQFIIVTHNRRTMEMGSVLYGVTMQEPGVSKIVSVRWEDEEAPKPKHAASAA